MIDLNLALFALLCVLQVADLWTTQKVIAKGGYEANPFMKPFVGEGDSMAPAVLLKAVIMAVIYQYFIEATWLLGFGCAVYAAVVAWNFNVLRKMQ